MPKIDSTALILAAFAAPGFWEVIKLAIAAIKEIFTGKKTITNAEIADRLDSQGRKIDSLERGLNQRNDADDEREAKACRRRILRADDEFRTKIRHSKDFFEDILRDIDFYEDYCATHAHFKNRCAESAIRNVIETYDRCKRENDFL